MQNPKLNSDDAFKTLLIIWFALVMSQVIFVVMIYAVKPEMLHFDLVRPALGDTPIVVAAFAVLTLANLAMSFIMPKRFLTQSVDQQDIGLVQTAMIIGCALCESVSLFGVLLAFAFNYKYFFIFSAIGILGTLLHFPRRGDVHAASFMT